MSQTQGVGTVMAKNRRSGKQAAGSLAVITQNACVCAWWAATLLTDDGFKTALKNLSLCFSQRWESQLSVQMKAKGSLAVVGP